MAFWGFGGGPTLKELFADGDDMVLVETIALTVEALHSRPKAKPLREEHLHVWRAWNTAGACSNGGFRCLFESADLNFPARLEAFRAIGAEEAVRSLELAASVFPGGRPQPEYDARLAFLEGLTKEQRDWKNHRCSALYDAAVIPPLSDYVRARKDLFLELPNVDIPRFTGAPSKGKPPKEGSSTPDVAGWIFGLGGYVEFHELRYDHGGRKLFTGPDEVPRRALTLAGITLPDHRRDADQTLAQLARWKGRFGIESVSLEGVRLGDAGLAVLREFPHLNDLMLGDSKIRDAALIHVAAIPKLRSLDLSGTNVTESGLAPLAALKELSFLDLKGIEISGSTLASLKGLTELVLGDAPLRDVDLTFLSGMADLETLEIAEMKISKAGLKQIAKMPKLEKLTLFDAGISELDLAAFAGHPCITTLEIHDLRISEEGARLLLQIPRLQKLTGWSKALDPAARKLLTESRPGLQVP